MRVCHLGKYYPPCRGGIETHVQTLARAQAAQGHDVRVVCFNHRDRDGREVTHETIARTRTEEASDGPVRVTRLGRVANLYRFDVSPRLLLEVGRLGADQVDVLHLHVPNPAMLLPLATLSAAAPLVVTHHSDVISQRLIARAIRPAEHVVYRRARLILSDSPTYGASSTLLQAYAPKVRVLPLGLVLDPFLAPTEEARSFADELKQTHGEPLWLSVGRLVYYKGLATALRALKEVPGKLLVIGVGPQEQELRRLAHELDVSDRLVLLGSVDDARLIGAYLAATALWFPSNARSEGFGQVQVEAMASGCPVLNCAIPSSGVPWVSPHDVSGLTAPVDDPAAFAASARRLLEEQGLRARLAEGARRRAREEFDHTLMAERCLREYERAGLA